MIDYLRTKKEAKRTKITGVYYAILIAQLRENIIEGEVETRCDVPSGQCTYIHTMQGAKRSLRNTEMKFIIVYPAYSPHLVPFNFFIFSNSTNNMPVLKMTRAM